MADVLASINLRSTPQTQRADPRQVPNNAGAYAFPITPRDQLRRFLILGVAGGTFYVGERTLAQENAQIVLDFAVDHTEDLVNDIVDISVAGRARKQDQALFALAAACSLSRDEYGRRLAFEALPMVVRTGTHLFQFVGYMEQFRGWGRGARRAVSKWYADKSVEDLSYQVLKYRRRHDWSHHDVLRVSHDAGYRADAEHRRLYDWICIQAQGDNPNSPRFGQSADITGLTLVEGYQRARTASLADLPELVQQYRLSWEMLPEAALNSPEVWEALLDNGMPQTALIRQLPRLSTLGLLSPLSARTQQVATQLADPARLRKGRVHPFRLLLAHRAYVLGRNRHLTWPPSAPIVDALDAGFYAAYQAVEPTGLRYMIALDVSQSMTYPIPDYSRPFLHGRPQEFLPLSAREASAAVALVIAATEPRHQIVGFTAGEPSLHDRISQRRSWTGYGSAITELPISPRQRLADAIRAVSDLPFGATDCSLPMRYAMAQGIEVDVFIILTDNETNQSTEHPFQSLRRYRERVNPAAKMIVLAMTSTGFTLADPTDAGMLDIAGLDAGVPNLIADFARGL